MVAGGQNVAAHIKEFVGDGRCKPEPARRVFGVGNHQIDLVRLHHVAQVVAYDLAPRTAEDITYKKNLHTLSFDPSIRTVRKGVSSPVQRWSENRNYPED